MDFVQCVDTTIGYTAGGWILKCYSASDAFVVQAYDPAGGGGGGAVVNCFTPPALPFTPAVTLRLVRGSIFSATNNGCANATILTYFFETWAPTEINNGVLYWEYPGLTAPATIRLVPL